MLHGIGERVAVVDATVVAELLAVIGDDEDHGPGQGGVVAAERREQAPEVLVQVRHRVS